jgi:hypothetical protein
MDKYQQRAGFLATVGCLLWLLPALAVAAAGQDLYTAEVTVSDQTAAVRAAALQSALGEVLVRVAGQNAVLDTEPARAMLKDPSRLVQQYRYFSGSETPVPQLRLWVRFDGEAIRQSLQQQGLAYWGTERPDTLTWLAVEDRGRRYVVSATDDSDVRRQIETAATGRGVPVLFPLMDLEDQSRVRFSDIWGGFFDNVLTASERYSTSAVLIGRLNRSASGGWAARWYLQVAGTPSAWTDSRQQLEELARQGIADAADILASRFAVAPASGSSDRLSITVSGIDSLADYARTGNYLASLTSVADVQVEQVAASGVRYALQLHGSLQDLTRIITIGTVLEPAPDAIPGSYRLRQ